LALLSLYLQGNRDECALTNLFFAYLFGSGSPKLENRTDMIQIAAYLPQATKKMGYIFFWIIEILF